MNKYIIKNCPAYNPKHCNCLNTKEIACLYRTDCVMKQIVNHCKDIEEYSDDYYTRPILELLDIQEVE